MSGSVAPRTRPREGEAVYSSRALLVGSDATKQRVMSALAGCNVAHFAVHAAAAVNDVPSSGMDSSMGAALQLYGFGL